MARTKKKTEPAPQPEPQPAVVNGPAGEVLTLAEAAAYLRLPEREVVELVHSQGLPGRIVGSEWRFLKAALQHWLSTGLPTPETRKAALLALAGAWKDDPYVEQELKEIYERRGRPMTEDEE